MKDFHLPQNVKIPNRSKPLYNAISDKVIIILYSSAH